MNEKTQDLQLEQEEQLDSFSDTLDTEVLIQKQDRASENLEQFLKIQIQDVTGETQYYKHVFSGINFFEHVSNFHEDMRKMDNKDFGISLRDDVWSSNWLNSLQKKLKTIRDNRRIQSKDEQRIDSKKKRTLVQRALKSYSENFRKFNEKNLMKSLADTISFDPAIEYANQLTLAFQNKEISINKLDMIKMILDIEKSQAPRLYARLVLYTSYELQRLSADSDNMSFKLISLEAIIKAEKSCYIRLGYIKILVEELIQKIDKLDVTQVLRLVNQGQKLRYGIQQEIMTAALQVVQTHISQSREEDLDRLILEFLSSQTRYLRPFSLINQSFTEKCMQIFNKNFNTAKINKNYIGFKKYDVFNIADLIEYIYDNQGHAYFKNETGRKFFQNLSEALMDLQNSMGIDLNHDIQIRSAKLLMNKVFADTSNNQNIEMQKNVQNLFLKYVKRDATKLRYIAQGLEMYDALGIIIDEDRKQLLIKFKQYLQKQEIKISDSVYAAQLYPMKIKSKAYEHLIKEVYQNHLDENQPLKFENEVEITLALLHDKNSPEILALNQQRLSRMSNGDMDSRVLNQFLDFFYQKRKRYINEPLLHIRVLELISIQKNVSRIQKDILEFYFEFLNFNYIPEKLKDHQQKQQLKDLINKIATLHPHIRLQHVSPQNLNINKIQKDQGQNKQNTVKSNFIFQKNRQKLETNDRQIAQ
ncbi:UNKNOWN [Stylonychia lemnae]|uniref:Uncharacterized protein n=1 Tax=Stylonychia lemnae TaxID=5949 RepID=A0A078AJZ6_STYLE|nr:UNKNOWN [Stylonychia lemnae]|eukprot:CDW82494.1 UNKNOWN [Stylonychia lemnae]